ncbi:efflux transporter outer membrane subunit [Agarilytica rhodophyticola]|uniref:efflux transporter outer membrane subunit n=1 Tax=Agarilytica rhodophyticola TaxID=1737490 RepID=UPI0013150AEF|nr:efflux transporter outer membrane subunit [Agarilytica rhodophyticola]
MQIGKIPSLLLVPLTCTMLLSAGCVTSTAKNESKVQSKIAGYKKFTPQSWATHVDPSQLQQARQINWLDTFNDPLLVNLVDQALVNNYNLQAASANVERARALAVQAGAQLQPQVNLAYANSRSGSAQNSNANASSQTLSAQLNWEVDLWGRISAGKRAAVASAEAAAADYKFTQYSIAAATARAYFIAIEAGRQVQILKDILTSLEETFRIVKIQYDNGLASAQDVALTNSDLASRREQLIALEASQRDALRALEVLLGRYPKGDISVQKNLPTLPAMPPAGIPSDILERRPDLIASERRVAAAFNSVKQAKAARLPQLSLTSSIGGSSNALSNITNPENVVWQIAGNLLAPIIDGGARRAQVKIATAEQKQALAAYAQAALDAFSDTETNLDLANTLNLREQELDVSVKEAEKAYKIAQLRHKEGEIALVDLLTVQQRVLSASSNKLSVQRLALEQRVNLFLALGGDWNINK